MRLFTRIVIIAFTMLLGVNASAQASSADAILGHWKATEKVLTIEIYKVGEEYRARLISFTDHHNATPSNERKDEKNPDARLRRRPLLGIDILTGLHYDAADRSWTDGSIYDVGSGKNYNANLELNDEGQLHVRAYKGMSLLGKSFHFTR